MSSLTCSPSPAGRRVRSTSCRTAERSRCCRWTLCFSRQCCLPQTPPGIYHNTFTQSCHVLLWISLPSSGMPLVTQCCNDSKLKFTIRKFQFIAHIQFVVWLLNILWFESKENRKKCLKKCGHWVYVVRHANMCVKCCEEERISELVS